MPPPGMTCSSDAANLRPPRAEPAKAVDPVCGMTVEPATAADRFEHGGVAYWFCASGCRRRFESDPSRYLTS
jgi:Cu+-exporting ATPase